MRGFFSPKPAKSGTTNIIYETPTSIKPIHLVPGKIYQNKFGQFRHDDMIDKPAGSAIFDTKASKFVHILSPTSELWTKALPHRTQILYRADIASIIGNLDIKPGKIVIEAGTGSGSLSVAIARSVMHTGKLHTYEFNQDRATIAQEEFATLGLSDYIRCEFRDVLADGFANPDFEKADALFLDLPKPWEALPLAFEVLKNGAKICSFSPCIEQVQKTCLALQELKACNIRTIETLARPYHAKSGEHGLSVVHLHDQERLHTGYLTFAIKP